MMPQYSSWLWKWCHPRASTPVLGPRPTVYGPRTGVEALGRHHFQSHLENCGIIAHDWPRRLGTYDKAIMVCRNRDAFCNLWERLMLVGVVEEAVTLPKMKRKCFPLSSIGFIIPSSLWTLDLCIPTGWFTYSLFTRPSSQIRTKLHDRPGCGFPVSFEFPPLPGMPSSASPQNLRKQSQKSAEFTGNLQPSWCEERVPIVLHMLLYFD